MQVYIILYISSVSLLLKGEKALSSKPPSFRFSAIVLMKVKLFNNLFSLNYVILNFTRVSVSFSI